MVHPQITQISADERSKISTPPAKPQTGASPPFPIKASPARTRFVDPRECEKESDYLLAELSEIPPLVRRAGAGD
jgi:hypothetical protein